MSLYFYTYIAVKIDKPDTQQTQLTLPTLEVGSAVQFGDPVWYGVIKEISKDIVEVETVSYCK